MRVFVVLWGCLEFFCLFFLDWNESISTYLLFIKVCVVDTDRKSSWCSRFTKVGKWELKPKVSVRYSLVRIWHHFKFLCQFSHRRSISVLNKQRLVCYLATSVWGVFSECAFEKVYFLKNKLKNRQAALCLVVQWFWPILTKLNELILPFSSVFCVNKDWPSLGIKMLLALNPKWKRGLLSLWPGEKGGFCWLLP